MPAPPSISCLSELRICFRPENARQMFHTMPPWADDVLPRPLLVEPKRVVNTSRRNRGALHRDFHRNEADVFRDYV